MKTYWILIASSLVGTGIVFLLHNLAIVTASIGWPIIILTLGLGLILADYKDPSGYIVMAISPVCYFISRYQMWHKLWPVVLILAGIAVFLRHIIRKKQSKD
ncbi:hypothetical protein ACFL27_24820 [candidate division CSSED10-310 bacterium]|uniref:DUF5668 domain-containing protein n=1 Tax=candidate division CSSED10-310 bacterium TaxID=2855610 RepID=A0ABV6Z4R1_UNCC1